MPEWAGKFLDTLIGDPNVSRAAAVAGVAPFLLLAGLGRPKPPTHGTGGGLA